MWGMEFYQLLSFVRQLGLALAGGASLWAMVFLYLAHKRKLEDSGGIFLDWIGLRLRWLVGLGSLLAVLGWLSLMMIVPSFAHEGVTLVTEKMDVLTAMGATSPLYVILLIVAILIVRHRKNPAKLYNEKKGTSWLYITSFVTASLAISYYTDLTSLPLKEVIFHMFHGFHSIFTLGTVLTLDFIFLSTQKAPFVQKHIFPFFSKISKVIWIGLSLDLLSTLLIYPEAVATTPRFFFAQSVLGILVINGILLSGVITRRMLHNIHIGHKEASKKWELFATIAGAISITSWASITFVDFFHGLDVKLWQLFSIYIAIIICAVIGHSIWNILDTRAERMR